MSTHDKTGETVVYVRLAIEILTYRTTNLRGLRMKMPVGTNANAMTNMMAAAMMRPPNRRRRSHRLTRHCISHDTSSADRILPESGERRAWAASLMHEDGMQELAARTLHRSGCAADVAD